MVDATGQTLGRLSTRVARCSWASTSPPSRRTSTWATSSSSSTPTKIRVTGKKLDDKIYYRHTGYMGGLKETPLRDMLQKHPERVIELSVHGMLPRNSLRSMSSATSRCTPAPITPTKRRSTPQESTPDARTPVAAAGNRYRDGATIMTQEQTTTTLPAGAVPLRHRPPQKSDRPRPPLPRQRHVRDQRQAVSGASSPVPHQIKLRLPFEAADVAGTFDVYAKITGGGVSAWADAVAHGIARALLTLDEKHRAAAAQSRPPHPRPAHQGAQEARPQARPQGAAVHQALTGAGSRRLRQIQIQGENNRVAHL